MRLLRIRDFRLLLLAYGCSSLGDHLALIALTLRVYDLTRSGWAVAALLLTELVPLVAFAPLAGMLVDRYETSRVLSLTALFQGVVALGLVWADSLFSILALSLLLNSGVTVARPALFSLVPGAVGEDRTTSANGYLEVARWSGAATGPLLAGVLTSQLGSDAALLVNAVTFGIVALTIPLLRTRRLPDPGGEAHEPVRARDGFVFIGRDALLRLVIVAMSAMVAFAAIDNVAEVFFAKEVLAAGDVGYGVLVTAWIVGMVIGATGIAGRLPAHALASAVLVSAVMGGGALLAAVAWPTLVTAVAAFVVGGAANGVQVVGIRSLIHRRVPDRLRGRVFAAQGALISGGQMGAMALGAGLLPVVGPRGSLLVGGLGTTLAGAIALMLYGRLRRRAADRAPATTPRSGG